MAPKKDEEAKKTGQLIVAPTAILPEGTSKRKPGRPTKEHAKTNAKVFCVCCGAGYGGADIKNNRGLDKHYKFGCCLVIKAMMAGNPGVCRFCNESFTPSVEEKKAKVMKYGERISVVKKYDANMIKHAQICTRIQQLANSRKAELVSQEEIDQFILVPRHSDGGIQS